MKLAAALFAAAIAAFGCAQVPPSQRGWTTLIENEAGLHNFDRLGDANWHAEGGAIVADRGTAGYLVTRSAYKDFQVRAEFWAEPSTNSGLLIRMQNPKDPRPDNAYEVNIFDTRPGGQYGTGSIVDFVNVAPMPKAGGRWNTYLITARGPRIVVELNGQLTATLVDRRFASGPFALQFATGAPGQRAGAIKWRKVQVRPL